MSNTRTVTYRQPAIGVTSLLTIVFVILKLTGVIDWSWWLVLLPTLIPLGFGLITFITLCIVWLALDHKDKKSAQARRLRYGNATITAPNRRTSQRGTK
jgi:hypothetical protein